MFSRRYSADGRRPHRSVYDEQREQLLIHIYRSRSIYESIVANMRIEDELIYRSLPLLSGNGWQSSDSARGHGHSHSNSRNYGPHNGGIRRSHSPANVFNNTFNNANQADNLFGNSAANANLFQHFFVDIANAFAMNDTEAPLGMSNEQISEATRSCLFSELLEDTRERYTTCPITLDQFTDDTEVAVIVSCGHVFKRSALLSWLSSHNTCPSCRRSLVSNNANVHTGANHTNNNANNNNNNNNNINQPHFTGVGGNANAFSTHNHTGANESVSSTHRQEPERRFQMTFEGIGLTDEAARNDIASILEGIFQTSQNPSLSPARSQESSVHGNGSGVIYRVPPGELPFGELLPDTIPEQNPGDEGNESMRMDGVGGGDGSTGPDDGSA